MNTVIVTNSNNSKTVTAKELGSESVLIFTPIGDTLKKKYFESLEEKELSQMRSKVQAMLHELTDQIEKAIEKKEPPLGRMSTLKTQLGIVTPNHELEKLFSNFLFSLIMQEEAERQHLKIEVQQVGMMDPNNPRQPIVGFELICSFK